MRVVPLIVVLVPVLMIACEDDEGDCTAQGGVCSEYFGQAQTNIFVLCAGPHLDTAQCGRTDRVTYRHCCRAQTCAGGRGICREPCSAGRAAIVTADPECEYRVASEAAPMLLDCCEP